MKTPLLKELTPEEELAYLFEIYGADQPDRIFATLTESFNVLQARAQLLLSIITIFITIAGFSGPTIAASNLISKATICLGLALIIASAIVTFLGPLQLKWATQWKAATVNESLTALLHHRNARSSKYQTALILLIVGMASYVVGTLFYVFRL